eukprot:15362123-Ditylum_brightwellii.AAC.1
MAETVSVPVLDGEISVYDTFNTSSHGAGIQVDKIKYMIINALESHLIVEKVSGKKRKRCYYFSNMVKVTKQARMNDQPE